MRASSSLIVSGAFEPLCGVVCACVCCVGTCACIYVGTVTAGAVVRLSPELRESGWLCGIDGVGMRRLNVSVMEEGGVQAPRRQPQGDGSKAHLPLLQWAIASPQVAHGQEECEV